ncbi:helix-turn-helix domain-containing protein [Megamonas sp.]
MNEISERIIALRTKKDITQAEMAKKLRISPSVMNRIELGTRAIRDYELIAIAKFLEVSSDYILGLNTVPNNQTHSSSSNSTYSLSSEEQTLLSKYRQLPKDDKIRINTRIDVALENIEEKKKLEQEKTKGA